MRTGRSAVREEGGLRGKGSGGEGEETARPHDDLLLRLTAYCHQLSIKDRDIVD